MIQLETYKGTKSRHTCPACSSKGAFVRYQNENGEYISFDVGRCNRESKCGYHYKPKQFFADNPTASGERRGKTKKRGKRNYGFADKRQPQAEPEAREAAKPDYIPLEMFAPTLGNYDRNAFVQFLLNLFSECAEEIQNVLKLYFVGTYEDYTCFPNLDRSNRVCRAKLIRFNQTTGKRLKGQYDTSSLPAKLKLKDFQYKQIFFGEHLLPKFPNKPVAVVEAEKTAIIASLCFPEYVWLGSNNKSWLNAARLQRLGNRRIILYPDADGFELWQGIARDAKRLGAAVQVSSLIENHATAEQKENGYDLADYLIEQSAEINRRNDFADKHNLEIVRADADLRRQFETILAERKSILIVDGGLTETQAETIINEPEYVRQLVENLIEGAIEN